MKAEYPGKFSLSEERVDTWCHMLSDLDSENILAAGYHLVSTGGEWPPAIGTVRLTAKRIETGQMVPVSATEAWGNVYKRIQHRDVFLTVEEKEALQGVGSIYDLRRSEDLSFDRSIFIKNYEQQQKRRDLELTIMPDVQHVALVSGDESKILKGELDELVNVVANNLKTER